MKHSQAFSKSAYFGYLVLGLALVFSGLGLFWYTWMSFYGQSITAPFFQYSYLFTASLKELKDWYPRFFWLVWLVAHYGVYVGFLVLILLVYRFRHWFIFISEWLDYFNYPFSVSYYENLAFHLRQITQSLLVFLFFYGIGHLMQDQLGANSFLYQKYLARSFVVLLFAYVLNVLRVQWSQVQIFWQAWWGVPASPYTLAFLRMLLFGFLTVYYFFQGPNWEVWMLNNEPTGLPLMNWAAPFFHRVLPFYTYLYGAGVVVAFCIFLGIGTRYLLKIHALLVLFIIATPNFYGKLSHDQVFIWLPWVFTFSRCYDVWSVDAWWQKRRSQPFVAFPSAAYTIPIRLVWMLLGVIYFFPGMQKLWQSGFDWALSDSMVFQMQMEWVQHYDQVPALRLDHYPSLLKVGGLLLILFELSFPVLILQSKTRWLAIFGGLCFHNLAGQFMYITFYHLQLVYLFLVPWEKFSLFQCDSVAPLVSSEQQKPNLVLKVGLVVVALNAFCGLFFIHSYPFSSYPTYSNIVSSEINLLYFEGYEQDGAFVDILAAAKEAGFRREGAVIYEDEIIAHWQAGENIQDKVDLYWQLWCSKIPALTTITHLKVYYHRTPVQPERRHEYIINELIYENRLR